MPAKMLLVASWQQWKVGGSDAYTKFLAVGKLWEKLFLVEKVLSKNAKFEAKIVFRIK